MTAPEEDQPIAEYIEESRRVLGKLVADAFDDLEGPLLGAVLLVAEQHPTQDGIFRVLPLVPDEQSPFTSRGIVSDHVAEMEANQIIGYLRADLHDDEDEDDE